MTHIRKRLSRRSFLALTGTATIAVGVGATVYSLQAETPVTGAEINAFVAITPDGEIEFVCPALDLGQGAPVALAMILAEEGGASLSQVRILPAPRDAARYGNPDFGGRMVTADSKTTLGYWSILRHAGAEVRLALIATAARQNNWRIDDCHAQDHQVYHGPSGKSVSFKDVASGGRLRLPGADGADLKATKDFSLLGTSPESPDAVAIVTGRKKFGADMRAEGTHVAVLRRSTHLGGTVTSVNDSRAKEIAGVTHIHQLEDASAIAVVATDSWAAIKGAKALEVTWNSPTEYSSKIERTALESALVTPPTDPVILRASVVADQPIAPASTFYAPSLTHVLPEPLNATVEGNSLGLGATVTSATQSLDLDMRYTAQTWKTAPFMINNKATPVGGAYGRRVFNDTVREAAEIAKAIGQPVQVIRPQLDEMQRGQVRPAAAQRIVAELDDSGNLAYWRHEIASDGTLATHLPSSLKGEQGTEDNTATDGAYHPYRCSQQDVRWIRDRALPLPGFLRGVSVGYTVWAIETTIERLARKSSQCPLEWRLRHIDDPRLATVLHQVANMVRWGEPGRNLGLATMEFRGARVATVAEVIDRNVTALWIAVDAGQVIHRKQLLGQIEGGAVWGLSMALHEGLRFRNGAADITSLADYPMISNGQLPEIKIELVEEPNRSPAGAGEIGIPATIAAICNAMEVATGDTYDALPLEA